MHSETICADLTEDYTGVTGYYSTHFPRLCPPCVREATAHFYRKGKHYLITSGTTGYLPNPSGVAVGDSWHGPYTVQGDPHVGDDSHTSFHSQISSVFKAPGRKDLYIACADRWLPNAMEKKYEEYSKIFEAIFNPDAEIKMEDLMKGKEKDDMPVEETRIADYVWLPIRFEGERACIDWLDEWRIEDYE